VFIRFIQRNFPQGKRLLYCGLHERMFCTVAANIVLASLLLNAIAVFVFQRFIPLCFGLPQRISESNAATALVEREASASEMKTVTSSAAPAAARLLKELQSAANQQHKRGIVACFSRGCSFVLLTAALLPDRT
jgi:hypothetical protein